MELMSISAESAISSTIAYVIVLVAIAFIVVRVSPKKR
jgi:hypothetical protein